jgi:hypothetical protein
MHAYRLETVIPHNGELQLKALPFQPGASIEIIILALPSASGKANQFPLKDTVLKYADPTEPMAA